MAVHTGHDLVQFFLEPAKEAKPRGKGQDCPLIRIFRNIMGLQILIFLKPILHHPQEPVGQDQVIPGVHIDTVVIGQQVQNL